jgi:hypothetical protein
MAFFSGGNTPSAINRARIAQALDRKGWKYTTDKDGDLAGIWDGNVFFFLLMGPKKEVVQVRGRWEHPLPLAARAELLIQLDEWHREKNWPKAYTQVDGDKVWVMAEHAIDWEDGVTDAQLDRMLQNSIVTTLSLFEHLQSRLSN